MINNFHKTVLLNSSVDSLNIVTNGIYIDMTLGRGGHSDLILKRLGPDGKVIGIDQDEDAINYCTVKFKNDKRIILIKNNFYNLPVILKKLNISHVDGILMDLGVSSPQLDNSDRGFSYKKNGPLDMRMDQSQILDAQTVVNQYSFKELCKIFKLYGDVKTPKLVANGIIKFRSKYGSITTTQQLVEVIKASLPRKELLNPKHFARCYFQAIRIEVNDELNILEKTIGLAAQCLKQNGRLAIITFHSLEDKIVIKKFQELSKNTLPKEIPLSNTSHFQQYKIINIKPIVPSEEEVLDNSRSRSSKLRVLTKCYL